ncbi:membrane protein [Streptomyces phage Faust]|uniref:Membrane protein n=1 Tax=Streptomyces phage Faust TaxID=2767565 RepID=A0A7G9UZ05_9CAUD|nr:membrane protein [Streptomyces phage Faust]QNN99260.1 membrane protein [Streptomyces phage Faust]
MMVALWIVYAFLGVYALLLAWGFNTMDTQLRDISFKGAVVSILIGIFWLPALIILIIYLLASRK